MSKMGIRKDWNKGEAELVAKKGQQKATTRQVSKARPATSGKRTARPR